MIDSENTEKLPLIAKDNVSAPGSAGLFFKKPEKRKSTNAPEKRLNLFSADNEGDLLRLIAGFLPLPDLLSVIRCNSFTYDALKYQRGDRTLTAEKIQAVLTQIYTIAVAKRPWLITAEKFPEQAQENLRIKYIQSKIDKSEPVTLAELFNIVLNDIKTDDNKCESILFSSTFFSNKREQQQSLNTICFITVPFFLSLIIINSSASLLMGLQLLLRNNDAINQKAAIAMLCAGIMGIISALAAGALCSLTLLFNNTVGNYNDSYKSKRAARIVNDIIGNIEALQSQLIGTLPQAKNPDGNPRAKI